MRMIVAVDKNWGIGNAGHLLACIPNDLKNFKEKTLTEIVIMGHGTLRSLPNSQPLQHRINIVLSRNKELKVPGAIVCNSKKGVLCVVKEYKKHNVFVIGGQEIYNLFLNECDIAHVTKIHAKFKQVDRFCVNLEMAGRDWELIERTNLEKYKNLKYSFLTYKRRKLPDPFDLNQKRIFSFSTLYYSNMVTR